MTEPTLSDAGQRFQWKGSVTDAMTYGRNVLCRLAKLNAVCV